MRDGAWLLALAAEKGRSASGLAPLSWCGARALQAASFLVVQRSSGGGALLAAGARDWAPVQAAHLLLWGRLPIDGGSLGVSRTCWLRVGATSQRAGGGVPQLCERIPLLRRRETAVSGVPPVWNTCAALRFESRRVSSSRVPNPMQLHVGGRFTIWF